MNETPRRAVLSRGCVIGLSALVLACAGLAAPAAASAASQIVPVWALLDGGLPVSNARVSVVATTDDPAHVGDRRPLRQKNGARVEQTNAAGVAMLKFAQLPKRFTVVVRGGAADGRRLPGALYAEVTTYGAGTDVIEVNPVTTLTAFARTAGSGMGAAEARREVKQLLAIPAWHNTTSDLRNSDDWFDGDAYLGAARRRGSVLALDRVLLRELRDGDDDTRRFREPRAEMSSPLDWLSLISSPEKLFPKVLGVLVEGAAGAIKERAADGALGWLTSIAAQLGLVETEPDQLSEIQSALDAMGQQLTRLEGQVEALYTAIAQAELSQLAHQTDTTLGQIDHAQSQLMLLANMTPTDPTGRKFAQTIDDYIGAKLLDAPAILTRNLAPGIPLADNVLKATSKAVAAGTPKLFGARKYAQVKSVYDYFAAYQAQLAVLLTNYWHSRADTYSQETIKRELAQLQSNVSVAQRASLKPPPPQGSWLDTGTGLMWTFTDTPITALVARDGPLPTLRSEPPYSNWRIAGSEELTRALSSISGSARVYLNAELGFEDAVIRNAWTTDSLTKLNVRKTVPLFDGYLRVKVFDLGTKQMTDFTQPGTQYNDRLESQYWPVDKLNTAQGRNWLNAKVARGLFWVRLPHTGEEYWWGRLRPGQ